MAEKGYKVPKEFKELINLPFKDFEELKNLVLSGRWLIQRFAFEYPSMVVNLLFSPSEKFLYTAYAYLIFIGPVFFLILSFTISWWFLVGITISPLFARTKAKKLYNTIVFRSAFSSESIFCFLFYLRQISITSLDYKVCHFYKSIGNPSDATQ